MIDGRITTYLEGVMIIINLRPEMMRFPDPRISDEVIGNSSESNMATSSEMLKALEMG